MIVEPAMKLLVAHNVPAARKGGMSRLMGFTHDRLSRFGYDVDYMHADAVAAGPFAARAAFPIAVQRRVRAAAALGAPYDLVNIHEPSAAAAIWSRGSRRHPKIVVTTHGVEQRAWELALEEGRLGRGGPGVKSRLVYPLTSLWQSRVGLTRADHVLCLNDEDRRYLVDRLDVDERRITRIFPGADPMFAETAASRDYTRADRLLFAATWRQNKGIADLMPAFTTLLAASPSLRLIVLGAGVPDRVVAASFPEHVRPAVTCVTTSNEAETAAAFAAADIFVLPSLFEGTPLTLVEAMASGLPIVTTAVCGMKDVIADGRNGLLVPIRSPEEIVTAVRALLDNVALRQTMGSAARRDALSTYTWDRAAAQLAAVYGDLLGRPTTARKAS